MYVCQLGRSVQNAIAYVGCFKLSSNCEIMLKLIVAFSVAIVFITIQN